MEPVAKFLGYLALTPIVALVAAIPAGFACMLLLGALHHTISPAVPALGFVQVYPLALFLGWTIAFLRPSQGSS